MLAAAFASDVATVTPGVCAAIREAISAESSHAKREVMRHALVELSRRVGELASLVDHEVRERFDAKLGPDAGALARVALRHESPSEELALESCAARLGERARPELSKLTLRMSALLGSEPLDDSRNPVLPRLFADSLMGAIAGLGFAGDARLAVFESYGPALLYITPGLYLHANTLLGER